MMTDAAQSTSYVGRPLCRREDMKFFTGKGRYVDDIKLPGILYLAVLRSPDAHARITGVDLSAVRAAAGVRLALAGDDLTTKIGNIKPNWIVPGTLVPDRPVMAVNRVRFVGECVALAVAETREAAYDALERFDVDYEALPAVIDEEGAIGDGAPRLHENIPNNTTTYFKIGGGLPGGSGAALTPRQQLAYSDLSRDPRHSRRAKHRWPADDLSAQSGSSYASTLDRRNSWYSGASAASSRAGYRWRVRGKDASLSRGTALCLSRPRAEISG